MYLSMGIQIFGGKRKNALQNEVKFSKRAGRPPNSPLYVCVPEDISGMKRPFGLCKVLFELDLGDMILMTLSTYYGYRQIVSIMRSISRETS